MSAESVFTMIFCGEVALLIWLAWYIRRYNLDRDRRNREWLRLWLQSRKCLTCDGYGYVDGRICRKCDETGFRPERRSA